MNEGNYCDIVYSMYAEAGCFYCEGPETLYTSYDCALIHEFAHLDYYEDQLGYQAQYFPENYLSEYDYPIEIDCSDSSTITCQAVVNQYSSALTDNIEEACNQAWDTTESYSEDEAIEAAQDCFWGLADEICSYADSKNWAECGCCP